MGGTESVKSSSALTTDDKLRQLYEQNERLARQKEELIASNIRNRTLEAERLYLVLKEIEDEHSRDYSQMAGKCNAVENDMVDAAVKFAELEKE